MAEERLERMDRDEGAEERDFVGMYLDEIARTPLLTAAEEVDLAAAIEAGLYAEQLLDQGRVPRGVQRDELDQLVKLCRGAKTRFIPGNLRLGVSGARE